MSTSFPGNPYCPRTVQGDSLLTVSKAFGRSIKTDRIQIRVLFDAFFLNLSHCKNHGFGNASRLKPTLRFG